MTTQIKRYAWSALVVMTTIALSINTVFAQEEAEAAEAGGSVGLMLAVLGLGALVILGLGMAMNAQADDELAGQE